MIHHKSVISSIVFIVLLGGCASTEVRNFFPAVGSEVILKQELTSRNSTRVFIQNGQMLDRGDVNVGNPNCQFVLLRPRGETGGLSIQPDTFTVTRTFRESQRGTVNATMTTFMELSSELQPEVSQLACQRWGSPRLDSFLTIDEMKATLNPIVELNLGDE
jgi:hypothetical protein